MPLLYPLTTNYYPLTTNYYPLITNYLFKKIWYPMSQLRQLWGWQ